MMGRMGFFGGLFGPKVQPTPVRDLASFEAQVLKSDKPVIVDVWGPRCPPCQKLAPVLIDVATKHRERVHVVEICAADTDPQLLGRLDVRATPTLIIYHRGEELGRSTGFRPSAWFDDMLDAEFPRE